MRSVKYILAAGAASVMSTAALAADMPSIMPPPYYAPQPIVEDFGGWYLRGDIGQTNTNGKLHYADLDRLPAGASVVQQGQGFSGGTSFGLGVGYQVNGWFRADITGEFRSKISFNGFDTITYNPGGSLGDTYFGGYSSWVGMVNAYADLGTWWCVTPFIGVGVGAAHIKTSGIQDNTTVFTTVLAPNGNLGGGSQNIVTGGSYFAQGASKTNLAWALHAGLAYKVSNNFTVEFAYRYLDMGTAIHGVGRSFDGSNPGQSSFQYRDLVSHDIRVGMRWMLDSGGYAPPPPPLLVRKG